MNNILIISDIHLGSDICQDKNLISLLKKIESKDIIIDKLIINGDLFDSWDFRRLKRDHWKILSHIRKISYSINVIWISGNHDGPADMVSHLIGVDFMNEYSFISGNKKILVLHGDIFDNFISKYPRFTKIVDFIYRLIQKYDRYNNTEYYYSSLAKRNSKIFLRCSEQICEKAKTYGKLHNVDAIICGHTHSPLTNVKDGIEYYNSGSWTEKLCSYILVSNGHISIKYMA
jgi:UDP-2,3-diacylglucosamine pyrophosphatase LpxH